MWRGRDVCSPTHAHSSLGGCRQHVRGGVECHPVSAQPLQSCSRGGGAGGRNRKGQEAGCSSRKQEEVTVATQTSACAALQHIRASRCMLRRLPVLVVAVYTMMRASPVVRSQMSALCRPSACSAIIAPVRCCHARMLHTATPARVCGRGTPVTERTLLRHACRPAPALRTQRLSVRSQSGGPDYSAVHRNIALELVRSAKRVHELDLSLWALAWTKPLLALAPLLARRRSAGGTLCIESAPPRAIFEPARTGRGVTHALTRTA